MKYRTGKISAVAVIVLTALCGVGKAAAQSRQAADVPFEIGEELNFSVHWTVGNIGSARLSVTGTDTVRGEACYRIEGAAHSNKTIDLFYPVRDKFVSYMDRDELFSRMFIKNQKEGSHERHRQFIYFHGQGIRVDMVSGDTADIVPEAQDDLSIFYYFRTLELDVGRGYLLENFVDDDGNPLKVAVHGRETVEVPAGRFDCWLVEPYIRSGGLFKHKGNLLIWITADEDRIPVKMSSDLDFGKVVVMLETYRLEKNQPLRGDLSWQGNIAD